MTTDERLVKVEGQLARIRWFNRCLIGCIALSLGVWLTWRTFGPENAWAQSGTKEIRANKFVLENESGEERASLAMDMGGPRLRLLDENGTIRASLNVFKDGSAFAMNDKNGKMRVSLLMLPEGPRLSLLDESSKPVWQAP